MEEDEKIKKNGKMVFPNIPEIEIIESERQMHNSFLSLLKSKAHLNAVTIILPETLFSISKLQ